MQVLIPHIDIEPLQQYFNGYCIEIENSVQANSFFGLSYAYVSLLFSFLPAFNNKNLLYDLGQIISARVILYIGTK